MIKFEMFSRTKRTKICESIYVTFYRLQENLVTIFYSFIILITQTCKTKNITITRYYFIFPVPDKKEKNKLEQTEIEVKMTIKMKKHNLHSI